MSDQWTDRLSDYVDDELPPADRAAVEEHLRACVACGEVVADLERIVARARGLEDRAPDRDLWPAIAERIGLGRTDAEPMVFDRDRSSAHTRRWTFSLPQLAAAGIALMALSGGAAWLLHPSARAAVASRGGTAAPTPAVAVAASPRNGTRGYDAAVADLERVLQEGRGRLDTTTVRVIEHNLATIDSAIAQAQHAVASDSANLYLNTHLADTMRRKLELLRQAAALVSTVS